MVWVFANGPGDLGSIPGRVIPKTQKMVLDPSLLNTQHYKVRIKGKVGQSRERSSALPGVVAIKKGAFGSPSTMVANFTLLYSVMFNRIRTSDPSGLDKGRCSKFRVGSPVRQETPEDSQRTYRPKRSEYTDEDNSPKTLNNKKGWHDVKTTQPASLSVLGGTSL